MSIPIQAWVAPVVCHAIDRLTDDEVLAQSMSPAGTVVEPNALITAGSAAADEVELVDVLERLLVVADVVVLGAVVVDREVEVLLAGVLTALLVDGRLTADDEEAPGFGVAVLDEVRLTA